MDRSAPPAFEPDVATLRTVDGTRIADASPYVAALEPPARAARGRENERLFILLWLIGRPARRHYRELLEMVARTYWTTTGSITAALRRAAGAANQHLFQRNLRLAPSDRCYGGLSCAVLHGEDLFILQAGPGGAFIWQSDHHKIFPSQERLAHLGIGPLADARLHHVFVASGDVLLLTSPSLPRQAGVDAIIQTLPQAQVPSIIDDLERVSAEADITALVARMVQTEDQPAPSPPAEKVERGLKETIQETPEPTGDGPRATPKAIVQTPRRTWWEQLGTGFRAIGGAAKRALHLAGRGLSALARGGGIVGSSLIDSGKRTLKVLSRGIRFVGYSLFAAVSWSAGGFVTLVRRMLPGVEAPPAAGHRPRARPPRSAPEENRVVMMSIAIAIPIIVAIVVALSYLRFRRTSRLHELITRAEREIEAIESIGEDQESTRAHWKRALNLASEAVDLAPNDPTPAAMLAEAQSALDEIDQVVRLSPTSLFDFGSNNANRQLIIQSNMLFVFDPTDDWVAQLTVSTIDSSQDTEDEGYLIQADDQAGSSVVGDMVDCTWVEQANGRRSSALVVLTSSGDIISLDPSWDTEGNPDKRRSALGKPPQAPQALHSYQGRLYILDVPAGEEGQIWRYNPNGDAYTEDPEPYFEEEEEPPRPLTEAVDMAIDGFIYLLYTDGTVVKFLGGEVEDFQIRGVPGELGEEVIIAVDPHTHNGPVYLADRSSKRIVVLEPDGAFQKQIRTDGNFDGLEALTVDETAGRLYILNKGTVYEMSLR